jgi:hypothetical protein
LCLFSGVLLAPLTIGLGIYEWTSINSGRSSKKGLVFTWVGIGLASFSLFVLFLLAIGLLSGHR